ncbi:MAG: MaoC family dehydratase N-terminal domain-containing protein [Desulfobacterales bacterium]|nr:MaoC family dehydratase N-terminal domain-containing protein [Desulfobacterales bacterium]MBS3755861.1 MaoC family dehydratase N-terminal domain-containing protein [Desulfobacterales bacterium]
MRLSPQFAGTRLREYTTKVSWRDSMNYAAAISDSNEVYFNDEREGDIIAPPMFSVALTWPVSENLSDYIEADDFPAEIIPTMVHYTEHIEFCRPIMPGAKLVIRGKIAAVLRHWTGTHVILRFDAADESGRCVFIEHIGALFRGVECDGEGAGRSEVPEILRHKKNPEPADWQRRIEIDPLFTYIYDGCSNIYFPIHTSVKFARSVGLPGIIVQGTATLALAVREITNDFARGDPERIRTIACRFTDMVRPGSSISIEARSPDETSGPGRIRFDVKNENGKKAVSDGFVELST